MNYKSLLTTACTFVLLSSAQAVMIAVTGTQEPVFTHATDACDAQDFSDNTVRAFIDKDGVDQLLS